MSVFCVKNAMGGANCAAVILSDALHAFPLAFRTVFTFVRVARATAVF